MNLFTALRRHAKSSILNLALMGRMLAQKYQARKIYSSFEEMPTLAIMFFALASWIEISCLTLLTIKTIPQFIDITNKNPDALLTRQGVFALFVLSLLGFVYWFFGSIANRCNTILQNRLFK